MTKVSAEDPTVAIPAEQGMWIKRKVTILSDPYSLSRAKTVGVWSCFAVYLLGILVQWNFGHVPLPWEEGGTWNFRSIFPLFFFLAAGMFIAKIGKYVAEFAWRKCMESVKVFEKEPKGENQKQGQ